MVELIQSAWGDWWIVHDGAPIAVFLRNESTVEAHSVALKHAQNIYPDEQIATQAFRAARWA